MWYIMVKRIRVHVFISGQVQGVLFRYATQREAVKLNLSGWVQNMSDGRVEAIFEGNEAKVQRMISFCHKGPPSAKVTNVKIVYEDPLYRNKSFKILY